MDLLQNVVLEVVLPTLAAVAGALLLEVLRRALRKIDLDLTEAQAERLRRMVDDVIRMVDERAHRSARDGVAYPSTLKHLHAVRLLKDRLGDDIDEGALTDMIDERLPVVRGR